MNITITHARESDGRWIAEVKDQPGVLAYGRTQELATAAVLRVLATTLQLGSIP